LNRKPQTVEYDRIPQEFVVHAAEAIEEVIEAAQREAVRAKLCEVYYEVLTSLKAKPRSLVLQALPWLQELGFTQEDPNFPSQSAKVRATNRAKEKFRLQLEARLRESYTRADDYDRCVWRDALALIVDRGRRTP